MMYFRVLLVLAFLFLASCGGRSPSADSGGNPPPDGSTNESNSSVSSLSSSLSSQNSSSASDGTSAPPAGDGGDPISSPTTPDAPSDSLSRSVEAYAASLYPLLEENCTFCHGGRFDSLPAFASSDITISHDAALSYVDFESMANSRFVTKVANGHHCWGDCAANGMTIEQEIYNWYAAINDIVDVIGGGNNGSGNDDPANPPAPLLGTTRTNYDATGDFSVTAESGGSNCTIYRPRQLNGNNPVILWGNGTGATPRSYRQLLAHWASWGFVVAAANTTNAGTGEEMLACLNWLEQSPLAGQINLSRVGTSGHSQGGGGAIMAGTDSRVSTTAPIEGATLGLGHDRSSHTQQKGPMLLLSGSADTLVSPEVHHAPLFERATVPVFWATLEGASHFEPAGSGGRFRSITTAWFLYVLGSNPTAKPFFEGSNCGFCQASEWGVKTKNFSSGAGDLPGDDSSGGGDSPLPTPIPTPTPTPTSTPTPSEPQQPSGTTRTDYERTGNYSVTSHRGGTSCTIYRPENLDGSNGVILWGNGTGASPRTYSRLLTHWASWGFVVAAANTSNAGTGREMIGCLDWLERSNLAGQINLSKVGTSGHSQGGGGSIMAGTDPRITTTAPIEGYTLGLGHNSSSHTRQSGPMLLLSGASDTLVSPRLNHDPVFERANVPVFWAILAGASHFEPTSDGGGFRGITTAWFLYQLNGNTTATPFFEGSNCGFCQQRQWDVKKKDIP